MDTINLKKAMWGASLSCRREAFYQVGGINHGASQNEDAIFSLLLEKIGKVKILREPMVLIDGRRYNQGFFSAVREWFRGIGLNSIIILIKYVFLGKIESTRDTFSDHRENPDS